MHTRATATAVAIAAALGTAPAASHAASDAERLAAKKAFRAQQQQAAGQRERSSFSAALRQHDGTDQHLPAAKENMEVVSKLELTSPFGDVLPGQVADVSVFKNTAYLMSWNVNEPGTTGEGCKRGGFWSVDITNPAAPKQVAFVPALADSYHGEGAHNATLSTPAFQGDVLAVNNEPCGADGTGPGGFDLYDVSNPADPKILVQGAGDRSPDGSLEQDPAEEHANSAHSIFVWQDGPRAYAVIVDNTELNDVDIFDITDPRTPVMIGEFDLAERFPEIVANAAHGNSVFLHDMVVKEIGGRQTMLASYWDAGYVQLDVEDPANPKLITDTDFADVEPLFDLEVEGAPEGNAHQGEYSHDNQFILAADEDFATSRPTFEVTDGPRAGTRYEAGEFGFSTPISALPDGRLNGPVRFGGYGCTAGEDIPPASDITGLEEGEERILLVQRGPSEDPSAPYAACRFDEKMQNAIDAGYEGIVIAQRHQGDEGSDGPFCGGGEPREIAGMCVPHKALHELFGTTPSYAKNYSGEESPEIGEMGERILAISAFDGWGYAHLYDAKTSEELDQYAIQEAGDERFASGFGDLSIHEWATDPETNLAYGAYYSGGLRTIRFSRDKGIEEVGKFIDPEGSNFWGVEQFSAADGSRLIAGSDRDFGLYIMRYTGPGAVGPKPKPVDPPRQTPTNTPAATAPGIVKKPENFFKFGGEKTVTLRGRTASSTVNLPGAGSVVATLRARIGSKVRNLATARRTVTKAGNVRLTFRLSSKNATLLRRAIARRSTRRTSGVLRVQFTPKGGDKRTRNRSISLRAG